MQLLRRADVQTPVLIAVLGLVALLLALASSHALQATLLTGRALGLLGLGLLTAAIILTGRHVPNR